MEDAVMYKYVDALTQATPSDVRKAIHAATKND